MSARRGPYGRTRNHRAAAAHDAWGVGDEPVVVIDGWGASNYAKEH